MQRQSVRHPSALTMRAPSTRVTPPPTFERLRWYVRCMTWGAMPLTAIDIACSVRHLSILDEDANLDRELDPGLSPEVLERMHEIMLLSRRFDERMLSMQRQGRLGTFALVQGQEAAQVGAAAALGEDDWVVPSYRETAVAAWRGLPLHGMLLYNAGYNEGARIPEGHNDLPICIPVGSQLLHAAGLAYGQRIQGTGHVVMSFFGDGATSEGDFHEALNFARVFECPTIFVCQNNQYAISVPRSRQTRSKTLAQKGIAYDVPCVQVDGNDVLAVYSACAQAVTRARRESIPTLVECVTYRLSLHTTVDDPSKYRDDEEVKRWRQREPLIRFQKYLRRRELLNDSRLEELEDRIRERIDGFVEEAQAATAKLNDPSVMFDHVFAEAPPSLVRQRQEFSNTVKARSTANGGEPKGGRKEEHGADDHGAGAQPRAT